MDSNGFSDPYTCIKIGNQEFKTQKKKITLSPEWNEDFVM